MKSAYHLLVSARSSEDGATTGSASGESGVRWNEIWGLELPPKIRMFLWPVKYPPLCSGANQASCEY